MPDHPLYAAAYDRLIGPAERAGLAERRRRLLAWARGRVLEVGGGTGLNLRHYPSSVDGVAVLEPDGAMRRRLAARAAAAPVPVEVHPDTLGAAPFEAASFDTVVCTLVLCTVADLGAALGDVRRLLAPGGWLLFLEHVRATGVRELAQQALTPLWQRLAAGCRLDRDIPAAIRAAGFAITDIERFALPRASLLAPAVQGRARPRAGATKEAS